MANLRENKVSKILRVLLSFVLFIMIVLVSVSAFAKAVLLDKNKIEDAFTDYKYVSSVKDSVVEYSSDIYLMNGLDASSLDSIFDYELLKDSVKAYISNNIGSGVGYNESTYLEPIDTICDMLETDITSQVKANGLKYEDERVKHISDSVRNYLVNEIDISTPKVKTIINVASIASTAVLGVGLFFAVAVGLILFFIGNKRYRSIRALSISFSTAGSFEIFASIIACIVFRIKQIDIFPLYLRELLMDYIYSSIGSMVVIGCFLILVALIISIVVWKVRRGK